MELRELASAPSLGPLFARAAVTQRGRGGDLPAHGLHLAGVEVDRDHLLGYQHLCRFAGGDVLPHTYPHVLGFPLQVQLMADRDFPLPLPGLVHLENRITVHRRLTADDRLDLTVHAADLRPHAKGTLVDLVTEVDADGERVWEGRSTYLRRGRGDADAVAGEQAPTLPGGPPAGLLRLPEGLGRAYAAVSGDVNPIHLHALSAKAMGFPRAIAHGMWTAARTLATLGPAASGPSASTVWFRKPVLLPSTVEVVVGRADAQAHDGQAHDGQTERGRPNGGRTNGVRTVAGLRSGREEVREHLVLTLDT